jgi:hypothetical protein
MRIRRVISSTAIVMLSTAICTSAIAQSSAAVAPEQKPAVPTSAKNPVTRESLLGVDADGDGIRDDIEAIVAKDRSASTLDSNDDKEKQSASEKERALRSLSAERAVRKDPPRRNCLDYLMLEPKQRYKADLRLQGEANGMLGMHPCDPVMSPLLERPFESDFVQLDLGPVFLRY